MATNYYRAAFDSDIFWNKEQNKQSSNEKPSYNSKMPFNNNSLPVSSFKITDSHTRDQPLNKTQSINNPNVLNAYQSTAPIKQSNYEHRPHLSKSQLEMGNYEGHQYEYPYQEQSTREKNRSMEKYHKEETPFQRKMDEFYGKDSLKLISEQKNTYTTRDPREFNEPDDFNNSCNYNANAKSGHKYSREVCLSQPSRKIVKDKAPIRRIQVTKREALAKANQSNQSNQPYKQPQQQTFEQRVNFLKSNIFDNPDIAMINSVHSIPIKEKKIDTHVIKSTKRANSAEMDMKFDWKESKNNIWLAKYNKETALLSAKERKLNEIYGSLNQIDIENAKEPVSKQFYEGRKEIESKAMEHFQGSKQDSIKKQVENMSSLNGTDFYQKNYQLNANANTNTNASARANEVVHSYEIDNIHESDIKQIKKCFMNNGLHIYDTEMYDFSMNNAQPGRISVKIRENANDQAFQKNLIKAKDTLKKEKGLELKAKIKPTKSYINSIPQSLRWNDVNVEQFLKHRYEDSTDQKTHIKGYGNTNKKDKVTSIPYNLRYKNTLTKNIF